jgi:hypothetical protein
MESEEDIDKSIHEIFDAIEDGSLILIDSVGESDNPQEESHEHSLGELIPQKVIINNNSLDL